MDGVFQRVRGVESSICGYSGGEASDANYYRVASGTTKHAETLQITFDETIIPATVVLDIFFLIHNPTTLNRQGADIGRQYRSLLFYENQAQQKQFIAAAERAQQLWGSKIVTEIIPLDAFYEAEPEHHDFYTNNPTSPYCSAVVEPKISHARRSYAQWMNG